MYHVNIYYRNPGNIVTILNRKVFDWIKFPSVLKKGHTVYKFYQVFFSYRIIRYLMDIIHILMLSMIWITFRNKGINFSTQMQCIIIVI
jgi:hypothetical protein